MGYTGYKVTQYIDDNPLSPTYGNTWTERELDTSHCPTGDNQWVLVSTSCEATTSGFTGDMIYTYYNSATNQYSSTTTSSTECDADSLNEIWVNSGDTFCEQDEDGIYSGWAIQVQVQRNSNLLNYNETREVRLPDATCEEHLEPNWTTIYSHCTIVADHVTGQLSYDGTLEELQIDDNPSSPTFNQTRVIYTPDEENCPAIICDEVERTWEFVDDICGSMMPIEYGLTGLTPDTLYHVYREYESCIVGGVPVKTEPTNRFSATTYQTSVTDCVERWVDTTQTVCIEEVFSGKWFATYTGGTTSSAECDASSAITSGEVATTDLVRLEIGNCVTGISNSAFTSATTLSSVIIPNSVTSIGGYAFMNCNNLTSITIPDSVTSIGGYAFRNCTSLSSVTIPDSVTNIGTNAFASCTGLISVNIPTGLTSIPESLFDYDSHIDGTLEIPSGVTSIGNYAFWDCKNLDAIICRPVVPPTAGSTIFGGSTSCPVYVPCSSVADYKAASRWSNYADRIEGIPPCGEPASFKWKATYTGGTTSSAQCDSTSAITSGEVTTTDLVSVEIGNCVTSIGNGAFSYCSSLTSVTISNSVTNIGNGLFYYCKSLSSVTIPNSVTNIGYNAFNGCTSLTSVTIPDSVTSIGDFAFQYCSGLTSVTIPSGVTSIGGDAFYACKGLTSVTCLATTPPTLESSNAFNLTNNCPIYVPAASVNAYKTASRWSTYASRIQAIP